MDKSLVNKARRILASVLITALCVCNMAVPAFAEEAVAASFRLYQTEGTVTVQNQNGKEMTAMQDMKLFNGYQVSTEQKSYAWFEADSTKRFKMDAVSNLEVRKKGKQSELLLNSGNLFFNVTEHLQDDEVLNIRIPNPFMPDTPQRIATDTSQKLSIRFGETIKSYLASPELSLSDLQAIPAVFAGWLRYLMGVDDNGDAFDLSPDPLLATVRPYVQDLKLGAPADRETLSKTLAPLLSDASIFGVDLISAGLSDRVLDAFVSMLHGPGAVADTLAALTAQF